MDRIINSAEGYPLSREWLNFFENQSLEPINGLATAIGDNVIVSGVEEDNGAVSAGIIIYNGELLPFQAGPVGSTVVIVESLVSEGYDTNEDDTFNTILPVWATRVAKFGNPGDAGVVDSFLFAILWRCDSLRELSYNRLKLLKQGTININYQNGVANSIMVTGDLISSSFNGLQSEDHTNIEVSFESVNTANYMVVFEPNQATIDNVSNLFLFNPVRGTTSAFLNLRHGIANNIVFNIKIIGV